MRYLILCTVLAIPFPAMAQDPEPVSPIAEAADRAVAETGVPSVIPEIKRGKEISWLVSTFKTLRGMANEKRWGPFVSVLLMAFMSLFSFAFLRFGDLRAKLKPYMGEIAMALSVVGYVAIGMGTLEEGATAGDWWGVIAPGVKTGLAAVGGYELLVKRLWRHWGPKLLALAKRAVGKIIKSANAE